MFGSIISILLQGYALVLRLTGKGGSFPRPLNRDEEEKLLAEKSLGDKKAREKLITHNLRLVPHVIKKYNVNEVGVDLEDLISIGTIGLVKAIDSFCSEKQTKLSTYSCKCIQNEILMFLRKAKFGKEFSLDAPLEGEADGSPLAIMDMLQTEDGVQERLELEADCQKARSLVAKLEGRTKEIIMLRYGIGAERPLTQKEVADKFGISRSYVSRIEKKALETLREMFSEAFPLDNSLDKECVDVV